MSKNITIKDVAKVAGVSVATVSYVINSRTDQKISEDTRKKILQVINLLGYVPNQNARCLVNNKNRNLYLITRNDGNILYRAEVHDFVKDLASFFKDTDLQFTIAGHELSKQLNNLNAIISLDLSKKEFSAIGDKTFTPLIALNSYINDPVFYQINTDYEKIKSKAQKFFKNDFYTFVIDTFNKERKEIITRTFDNTVFVNNLNQIDTHNKNILVFENSLYGILPRDNQILYINHDKDKMFQTLLKTIKLVEERIISDEHNILI